MKARLKKWKVDWIIEERLDPVTGQMTNRYYFKERLCGRVKLDNGIAKQLAGYKLIEKDLRNIISWLNQIQVLMEKFDEEEFTWEGNVMSPDRDTFQIIKGLFVASITFYGKIFTKAAGRRVKLESTWFSSDELLSGHNYIMSLRHSYAAHSGEDSPEKADIILAIDPVRRRETAPQLFCELMQPDTVGPEDITTFKKIVDELHEKVKNKISELSQLIFQKEVIEKGMNHLYRQIKGTPNKRLHKGRS